MRNLLLCIIVKAKLRHGMLLIGSVFVLQATSCTVSWSKQHAHGYLAHADVFLVPKSVLQYVCPPSRPGYCPAGPCSCRPGRRPWAQSTVPGRAGGPWVQEPVFLNNEVIVSSPTEGP